MQVTRTLISTALVCWLVICGVFAQNHQDLVVRELGRRNSQVDMPQTQDSPTPQGSSSSSNPDLTASRNEVLEKLHLELKQLDTERQKVVKNRAENWKKKSGALRTRAYRKRLEIQGVQKGLPIKPIRSLDSERISQRLKSAKHPSLTTLQQRIEQLEKQRDNNPDQKEKKLLQSRLGNNRRQLKQDTMMEEIEAGKDPREVAGALQQKVDEVKKEIDELEMKINRERLFLDPAALKKLRDKVSNLRTRTLKKALERSQQSQASPSHNSNEEAEVEATSDSAAASLTLTGTGMAENLNSNLPGGDGLETEQDQDGDGHGGCFREDFDLYLWGKECNGQDLANHSNWQESEGQYYL